MAKQVGWQLDKMPEKVTALATFHGQLLNKMNNDPNVNSRISNAAAGIVSKYFEFYVDAIARIDKYRYHHIYEFGMTGNKDGRLFKSTVRNGKITYSLIDATVPNKNGEPFSKKAFIMEAGEPIVITPKSASFLVYDLNGETIVSRKSVITQPGGPYVAGAFKNIADEFFKSNMPNKALREFGFFSTIAKEINAETNSVSAKINRGAINQSAQLAAQSAYGIVGKVEGIDNRL
jgi:hypothetical protein